MKDIRIMSVWYWVLLSFIVARTAKHSMEHPPEFEDDPEELGEDTELITLHGDLQEVLGDQTFETEQDLEDCMDKNGIPDLDILLVEEKIALEKTIRFTTSSLLRAPWPRFFALAFPLGICRVHNVPLSNRRQQ